MFKWPRRDNYLQSHIPEELLSAYLDGEVTVQERARVDSHLVACAACRENLQSLRNAVALVQALPRVPVPRAFTLTEEMVGLHPAQARSSWIVVYLRGMSAVAALLLIVLLGGDFLLLRSSQPAPQAVAERRLVEAQPSEQPPVERAVERAAASVDATRETRAVEKEEEPALSLAVAPEEATRSEQEESVARATAVEEATTPTPQPTQRLPISPPAAVPPRGPGGAGGAGGGGAEGDAGGGGGGSDLGPGVEPIPTEPPPQPEETPPTLTEDAATKATRPSMKSAEAVEPTPPPEPTTTPASALAVTPAPTPTFTPPAETVVTPTSTGEARRALSGATVTPPSVPAEAAAGATLAAEGTPTPLPEPTMTLPAPQAERAGAEPAPRHAWEAPLRVAEASLAVLIVLLLTASWVAARRA